MKRLDKKKIEITLKKVEDLRKSRWLDIWSIAKINNDKLKVAQWDIYLNKSDKLIRKAKNLLEFL